MPMSTDFQERLYPNLESIINHFGTPFHIYDEVGIRKTGEYLKEAFLKFDGFREFFAVKALPNPDILEIMLEMGFGFDCSSIPELIISRQVGGKPEDIMFTSDNTSIEEFQSAFDSGGSIINLDDISLIDKLPIIPETISFRYNPGFKNFGNQIIGKPMEAKYGLGQNQLLSAYKKIRELGVKRFGIHTMIISNELDFNCMVDTVSFLTSQVEGISSSLGIEFEYINMGGGIGLPYKPTDKPFDILSMVDGISPIMLSFKKRNGYLPRLLMESGRYMTGPHGVLISKVINRKETYRNYVGIDACMSDLMRPAIYGTYHHITTVNEGVRNRKKEIVDVVGSLCENNDKFAVQRRLPRFNIGDIICIHDTGAHGHSMGFNYNGRLRHMELLLKKDGSVKLIRRNEEIRDYFATLSFSNKSLKI